MSFRARPLSGRRGISLEPSAFRALYYRALIARNEEDGLARAIADLELVAREFPQSRDVRRELGLSYYLAHKDDLAVREFEAAQALDPDDLPCHFYLAVLYRRAGLAAKAAEQSALYFEKRDDAESSTRSDMFLTMHPEMNDESLPVHVHSQHGSKTTGPSSPSQR